MKSHQKAAVKIVSKTSLSTSSGHSSARLLENDRVPFDVEREIAIMKLVDHPNIMRLYDVWETSTHLFLIMEYVEGGELFEYLCKKVRLPASEALGMFQQIIAAMDYCHCFHIAHRDLKPENLLLDNDKNIKVADFGMAAWQSDGVLLDTACGSPHYAAPEVVMGALYNGAAADVWSCGVVLFAMLSGKLPFDDDDIENLLNKVKEGIFEMPEDIDPLAQNLLHRMLVKDPANRIAMAEIFKDPFFLSCPPKEVNGMIPPNLDEIARPLGPITAIDLDIFANLRALWQDASDDEIRESLQQDQHNWQKGVYHLLIEYRAKKMEDYDEDEEKIIESLRERKRRRQEMKAAKANAMTANRVELNGDPTVVPLHVEHLQGGKVNDAQSLQIVDSSPPEIVFQSSSPIRIQYNAIPLENREAQSPLSSLTAPLSPMPANSPLSPIWDALNSLPHDDPVIGGYISQIIQYINSPQMQEVVAAEMNGPPTNSREDQWSTIGIADTSYRNDPEEDEKSNCRGKENRDVQGGHNAKGLKNALKAKRSSLKGANTQTRIPLAARHVQIAEPLPTSSKLRKKRGNPRSTDSPTPPEILHSPTFTVESSPKRAWLHNVFNLRPTRFTLYSLRDVCDTRNECRRLLMNMGVKVVLIQAEGPGILKCKLKPKGVKFRVEVQPLENEALKEREFLVRLLFVQEKGVQETFKDILANIRRDWALDVVDAGGFEQETETDWQWDIVEALHA
jgi:serine/threonine-protein kinase HSL1 (negative regulator of Swe1 kinase)